MGYTDRQLLWKVEIPLAIPAITAGLRIATVTTIGLVTVTSLIGLGGLGYYIQLGLDRTFSTAVILGGALSFVLAVIVDVLLLQSERWLTPWTRRRSPRSHGVNELIDWFQTTPDIWATILQHLKLSYLPVLGALLVAMPVGLWIGHYRRLEFFAVTAAGLGRAIPSFADPRPRTPYLDQVGPRAGVLAELRRPVLPSASPRS